MIKALALLTLGVAVMAHHETLDSRQQVLVRQLYNSIVTPEYNAYVRPYGLNGTDSATYIYVQLQDTNIINVDETLGTFTFQAYARREWTDPRLAYNDSSVSYIPISGYNYTNYIWTPSNDLYFLNGLDVGNFPTNYHYSPRTFRIYPNGRVFTSCRITQTIYCPAFFQAGAGREVVCPVRLGSYGYFSDEIRLFYPEGAPGGGVSVYSDVRLPRYTFGGVTTYPTCQYQGGKLRTDDEEGHSHSCLQADFRFTRV